MIGRIMFALAILLLATRCVSPEQRAEIEQRRSEKAFGRAASCSTTELARSAMAAHMSYDQVWLSAIAAVNASGLMIKMTDRESGVIFAQSANDYFSSDLPPRVQLNVQIVARDDWTVVSEASAVGNVLLQDPEKPIKRFRRNLFSILAAAGMTDIFSCAGMSAAEAAAVAAQADAMDAAAAPQ